MLRFCVLASGSSANAVVVDAPGGRFLIDCGLSASRMEQRLLSVGINPETIAAILVTHEHSDHIFGVRVFSRRYKVPVFGSPQTMYALREIGARGHAEELCPIGSSVDLCGCSVTSFAVQHDAVAPVGYRVTTSDAVFAYATDLGAVTPEVKLGLAGAHGVVLESNHDLEMLYASAYPWDLQQRILSPFGHLSNLDSAALLASPELSSVRYAVLAHLSENCNTPEKAHATAQAALQGANRPNVVTASQHAATPWFDLVAGSDLLVG